MVALRARSLVVFVGAGGADIVIYLGEYWPKTIAYNYHIGNYHEATYVCNVLYSTAKWFILCVNKMVSVICSEI